MSELVPRDEVRSALEARRELGPDYEDQLVDSLVEKIEQRLAERERSSPPGVSVPVAIVSLVFAVPMTAIAMDSIPALAIVWVGIVLVNLAVSGTLRSGRRPRR